MQKMKSSKPRTVHSKQRFSRPHVRSVALSVTFSRDLKEKHKVDHIRVRKGDSVKIMRGDFKGIEGKVLKTFPKIGRVTIEGVTREKLKGGTVPVKVHASKLMITNMNLDDKIRKKALEK